MPVQMTYRSENFDIATGILALTAALITWQFKDQRWFLWLFNIIGTMLLARIILIVNLSNEMPPKKRVGGYPQGQEVLVSLYFPYVWLAAVIVPAAMFFHLALFRRLWDERRTDAVRAQQ